MNNLITKDDAAKLLSLSKDGINNLVSKGVLRSKLIKGVVYLDRTDIQKYTSATSPSIADKAYLEEKQIQKRLYYNTDYLLKVAKIALATVSLFAIFSIILISLIYVYLMKNPASSSEFFGYFYTVNMEKNSGASISTDDVNSITTKTPILGNIIRPWADLALLILKAKDNNRYQQFIINPLTGTPGLQGSEGAAGTQGLMGLLGPRGETGKKGSTGSQGEKGATGSTGAAGEKGEKGDKGDLGVAGATGAAGEKGEKGEKGAQGDKGDKGDKGEKGDTGDPSNFLYGSFYDTTTQQNLIANSAYTVTYNTVLEATGISIVNNSRITFSRTGVYNIQFSLVLVKTDSGTDTVDVWLTKDGNIVPDSNTRISLFEKNDYKIAAWNFVMTMQAGHYLELKWASADTDISLETSGPFTNPTRPRIPSVILTVTQVR